MNINFNLEDALVKQLSEYAKLEGRSRNDILREAIQYWITQQQTAAWPKSILSFKGDPEFPAFESYRTELSMQEARMVCLDWQKKLTGKNYSDSAELLKKDRKR